MWHNRTQSPCRIIPADAGSTVGGSDVAAIMGDHPRGCGEHDHPVILAKRNRGSSPRMRGALFWTGPGTQERRIIPADAGSTNRHLRQQLFQKDHPRGCGEHGADTPSQPTSRGSSPRMRGAPYLYVVRIFDTGIIPADAGSTDDILKEFPGEKDHPRGCGEHI